MRVKRSGLTGRVKEVETFSRSGGDALVASHKTKDRIPVATEKMKKRDRLNPPKGKRDYSVETSSTSSDYSGSHKALESRDRSERRSYGHQTGKVYEIDDD